jgi:uncharacterized protein involved in response to NO
MQDQRESRHNPQRSILVIGLLVAALVALVGFMATSPSGMLGFLQSVEEANVFSISVLVSVIGIVFILLHRSGMSFGEAEKIDLTKM